MTPFLVEADSLTKQYNHTWALKGLSLKLRRAETLALLGPNGAGKTTALHIMLGLVEPTAGSVRVFGLNPLSHRAEVAQRINFVSSETRLPSNLSVAENLHIYSLLYSVPHAADRVQALLKIFNMQPLMNRVSGSLSSGERTRLNLIKALLNDPEILFLDEPTANLDPDIADQVRGHLKTIQAQTGMGIIYTSHNMHEVEIISHRVLFLFKGQEVIQGRVDEIKKRYGSENLEQAFLSIARQNPGTGA